MSALDVPLAAAVLAAALAWLLAPPLCRAAWAHGLLDRPRGPLKGQATPVAYLGGVAVYLAVLLSLSALGPLAAPHLALLLGASLMLSLGLVDDMRPLPPGLKLMGQALAAWITVRAGICLELNTIPKAAAQALSFVWLIGMANAVNILDVADGLATGVAAIAAAALGGMAHADADAPSAAVGLALAGALLGFLPSNRAPARMYLGDAGSLCVGHLLGALALCSHGVERGPWAVLIPCCVLAVPLLETALVCVARLGRGLSPLHGSPDHFALRLGARGWGAAQVAALGWGLGLIGAALGWWARSAPEALLAAGIGAAAALAWFSTLPAPVGGHALTQTCSARSPAPRG